MKVVMDLNQLLDIPVMWNMTLRNAIASGAAGAMIFGGVVPFIPQYLEIKRSGNTEGFSTFVCLTLLVANILRLMFWFGKHFELPLVAQSIIMIITMLLLVRLCTEVKNRNEIISARSHTFLDASPEHASKTPVRKNSVHDFMKFESKYFWRWTDFTSYLQFLVTFATGIGLLTYLLINNTLYIELLGFMSLFTEAMLGAPQFYRNLLMKSTKGMSVKMVCFWTCGDIFKTVYFILRAQPIQFSVCGALQVSLDLAILTQVVYYGSKPAVL
ncbi:solute carrier family 66 member 2-like isoform X1 [Tubulanus polymorphus]|uniref:solute carrier family 66 member 2-like isoform X1 n=1 Tax=Tubulanus polymorphus TaxID=672921 RepID=UPI003DA63C0E